MRKLATVGLAGVKSNEEDLLDMCACANERVAIESAGIDAVHQLHAWALTPVA